MKDKKSGKYFFFSLLGLFIFAGGLLSVMLYPDRTGMYEVIPYLCVGIGTGIFGGNLGTAISNKITAGSPAALNQAESREKENRHHLIGDMAKARAYDLMLYVFPAILFVFTIMQVNMYIILTLVAVYLMNALSMIYFANKYHKRL